MSVVGVIGGSGVYQIEGLDHARWERVASSFGEPSSELLFGDLHGQPMVFLPRHGRGHRIPPTDVNYRANIDALKRAGATDVISVSAVGSFREELSPGTFVIVDQFLDRTSLRRSTFFGPGLVAHVAFAHPVCARLGDSIEQAAKAASIPVVRGGTYVCIEGPQFSTLAESRLYKSWGCAVIGMTAQPEAKLAREAELCYGSLAMVTDYDCWHPGHDSVTVSQILAVLARNADRARTVVRQTVPLLKERPATCPHGCDRALDNALVTGPDARDPALLRQLDAIAGRVLMSETR